MTNYEKIKSMTIEDMAKMLYRDSATCEDCPTDEYCTKYGEEQDCTYIIEQWLKTEVDI